MQSHLLCCIVRLSKATSDEQLHCFGECTLSHQIVHALADSVGAHFSAATSSFHSLAIRIKQGRNSCECFFKSLGILIFGSLL